MQKLLLVLLLDEGVRHRHAAMHHDDGVVRQHLCRALIQRHPLQQKRRRRLVLRLLLLILLLLRCRRAALLAVSTGVKQDAAHGALKRGVADTGKRVKRALQRHREVKAVTVDGIHNVEIAFRGGVAVWAGQGAGVRNGGGKTAWTRGRCQQLWWLRRRGRLHGVRPRLRRYVV